MNDNVTKLPTKPSDQELANEHRKKLMDALNIVCELSEAANKDGFEVTFGLQRHDAMKSWFINQLVIAKHF